MVIEPQIVADGLLESDGAAMRAALDLTFAQKGKAALDQIEPGAGGRGEMQHEARVASKPGAYRRGFVGTVVYP